MSGYRDSGETYEDWRFVRDFDYGEHWKRVAWFAFDALQRELHIPSDVMASMLGVSTGTIKVWRRKQRIGNPLIFRALHSLAKERSK